jgi:hypothetical protein
MTRIMVTRKSSREAEPVPTGSDVPVHTAQLDEAIRLLARIDDLLKRTSPQGA